ncbi:MAG: hemolysin III family protein [Rubrivivax sp.]|nr:hemolysin III family protein [Rubrivivax sp.]
MAAPAWSAPLVEPLAGADTEASAAAARPRSRRQCPREERANALSHGIGFVAAAAAWPLLSDYAALRGGSLAALGMAVFCLSAMLVYAASMIYHALPPGRAKHLAHRVDHAAIFVFIAGSYTPFALGPLADSLGAPVLAGVWSLAGVGVGCKVLGRLQHRVLSMALYTAMGWMALGLLGPLQSRTGADAAMLLVAGGAAYTVGAAFFFYDDRLRYGHFVWHLFVLTGSTCHVLAALAALR